MTTPRLLPSLPPTSLFDPPSRWYHANVHGDTNDRWLLQVPRDDASRPAAGFPLILSLHGGQECGDYQKPARETLSLMAAAGGLSGLADALADVIPAFRSAVLLSPQQDCRDFWPRVATLIRILSNATATLPIDRRRIYATGFSMGGCGVHAILSR